MDRTATEWMVQPLRRSEFSGRSSRAEYWWFFRFALLAAIAASMPDDILGLKGLGVGPLVSLGLLVAQVAVGVRRRHASAIAGGGSPAAC